MQVGVRELKAKLSSYLAMAGDGESITITDRGRPVARLVPHGDRGGIERGIAEGWIEPPRRNGLGAGPRFRSTMSVAEVLDEDRG